MPFRFQSEKGHFTWRSHIPKDEITDWARGLGPIKMMSIVHEVGDEHEDNPTPYEHTHALIWWKKRLDKTDPRFADLVNVNEDDEAPIHPNIQKRRGIDWVKHIVMKYHLGHKTKKDGKKYFIEPVELWQEGVEDWKLEAEKYDIAAGAPSLRDACLDLGIVPKSISDIRAIRAEGMKRKFDQMEDDCTKESLVEYGGPLWNKGKFSLVIEGSPGCGKTNWSIGQFEKPFVVSEIEDLKNLPAGCDGLIFDDCEFATLRMDKQKHIADVRQPRAIKMRHTNAYKPKLPQIFTTNDADKLFDWEGDGGAIKTRAILWKTGERKLWE